VAVDEQGRVYVADYGNHRVCVFDAEGRFIDGWGREGGGPGEFRLPSGVAVDGRGRVYVADGGNHRVQVFDDAGRFLARWGDKGLGLGKFRHPGALATDGRGLVYVADPANGLVQQFDGAGLFLGQWPWPIDGGGADPAPVGIASDRDGRFLVVAGARVVQLDQAGQATWSWGSDRWGEGRLQRPAGLAIAGNDIVVTDPGARRILRFRLLRPEVR
jgi:DNA-binding beta-propeller fold protein YncE